MKLNLAIPLRWWASACGMVLAGLLGGFLFGSIFGLSAAIVGAAIGSYFDLGVQSFRVNEKGVRMQHYFASSVEAMTGYVLADCEMPLADYQKITLAVTRVVKPRTSAFWFEAGRSNSFALSVAIRMFDKHCLEQPSLVRTLCRVLTEALEWGNAHNQGEQQRDKMLLRLQQIQDALDLPNAFFEEIQRQKPNQTAAQPLNSNRAASILGVDSQASPKDIKMAYKRKVRDIHPDRLIAQGASEDALRQASADMDRIRKAYEFLMARL